MIEIAEHNKEDCIKLINMIICEMPLIKTFKDDCLLERLFHLIAIIDSSYDINDNNYQLMSYESEERQSLIREWLLKYYNAKYFIDKLDFNDSEDRTKVAILIINILFKLRHSLKDIEQYLTNCESFVQFDEQLNDITRFDKLLEIVQNDLNKWKSEARYFKVKLDELTKQMERYEQNEAFNLNNNFNNISFNKNQNLFINKISNKQETDESIEKTQNMVITACQRSKSSKGSKNGLYAKKYAKVVPQIENNEDISILCAVCDKYFSTNYEYNTHLHKDHKNFEIVNTEIVNTRTTKSEANDKRLYRCTYQGCGKSFAKCYELKRHFVTHQPKNNRIFFVCDYANCAKKYAALNHLRAHQKAKHLSNNKFSVNDSSNTTKLLLQTNSINHSEKDFRIGSSQIETDHSVGHQCLDNGINSQNTATLTEDHDFRANQTLKIETSRSKEHSALIDHQYSL